ncbi:MAG: DUF402 domain-containing protein [Chloroflexia bacterium]|nr:DUF402 domain-containing protein [Chloroflexia bacterium]
MTSPLTSPAAVWHPGDQIALRFTWSGDLAWITPVTVVEDSPDLIALFLALDTPIKRPVMVDGHPVPRHQAYEPRQRVPWHLGDARWLATSVLWLARPGAAHAIGLFWQEPERTFLGWYGNLQAPLVRTPMGFDSTDHALDVQIAPDRTWRWKDEDEFADLQRRGLITATAAQAIRAEGERIIRAAEANEWPFNAGWEQWQPDTGWPIPTLPAGWDAV